MKAFLLLSLLVFISMVSQSCSSYEYKPVDTVITTDSHEFGNPNNR